MLARLAMNGYEPVDFIAATENIKLSAEDPVFYGGKLLMEFSWSKIQLLYFCKLIIVLIIVLVAVLNYRSFVSEKEEN